MVKANETVFKMTSLLSSLFGSSASSTASRIDTMKAAEKALMSFSHRFSWDHIYHNEHKNGQIRKEPPIKYHDIQLFDTLIPRSAVPLKNNGKQHSCQLFSCTKDSALVENTTNMLHNDVDVTNVDSSRHLIMHGVQVTRKSGYPVSSDNYNDADQPDDHGDAPPLVLLHGYMNGALYFYRNLIGLADHCKTVYSLDMLGWGLSSRPPFQMDKNHHHYNYKPSLVEHNRKLLEKRQETKHETHASEQVFVESLEAWRKAHNISKMTLAGHSMGGYMSVAYAEKYPERVDRLILISPAGVPDDEFIDVKARFQNAGIMARTMIGMVSSLFNFGVTPAGFLRNLPETRGREMVSRYIRGRLPAIQSPDEQTVLGEYLYTNAALPASGEDCLNKVLKPTAFARVPTLHRIPFLKVKHVSFIYGQNDWMDPTGGVEVMEVVQQLKKEKSLDQSHPTIEVYGVKNAGHLLMLENWQEFNSAMIMALGRSKVLPLYAPKPYKVLENGIVNSLKTAFFVQPRWERKQENVGSAAVDESQQSGEGSPSMQA